MCSGVVEAASARQESSTRRAAEMLAGVGLGKRDGLLSRVEGQDLGPCTTPSSSCCWRGTRFGWDARHLTSNYAATQPYLRPPILAIARSLSRLREPALRSCNRPRDLEISSEPARATGLASLHTLAAYFDAQGSTDCPTPTRNTNDRGLALAHPRPSPSPSAPPELRGCRSRDLTPSGQSRPNQVEQPLRYPLRAGSPGHSSCRARASPRSIPPAASAPSRNASG